MTVRITTPARKKELIGRAVADLGPAGSGYELAYMQDAPLHAMVDTVAWLAAEELHVQSEQLDQLSDAVMRLEAEHKQGWDEVGRLRKLIEDRWHACPDCGLSLGERGCGHG